MLGGVALAMGLLAGVRAPEAELRSVTSERIYFSSGQAAGFAAGQTLSLRRGRREIGRCLIDRASRKGSSCLSRVGRVGDRARLLSRRASPSKPRPPEGKTLDAGPGRGSALGAVRADVARALARMPDAWIAHAPRVVRVPPLRAEVALGHVSFVRQGAPGVHRQRLDVALREVSLGLLDTRAHLQLSVLGYAGRPERPRFAVGEPVDLYVYETALTSRPRGRGWVASLGRIRPQHVAGVPILDGVQFGLRFSDDAVELGVVAGSLPDPLRLEPTTERWMASLYTVGILREDELWVRGRLRGGVIAGAEGQLNGDVEGGLRMGWAGALQLGAGARALISEQGQATLASLRTAVDLRLTPWLRVDGSFRWRDASLEVLPEVAMGARHAQGALRFLVGGFELSAVGGYGALVGPTRPERGWAGAELAAREFLSWGVVAVGHQEGFGTYPGRTSWIRAVFILKDLRFLGRAAWYEDRAAALVTRDLGATLSAEWRLGAQIRLRGSLLGRLPLTPSMRESAAGLTGRLTLVGQL